MIAYHPAGLTVLEYFTEIRKRKHSLYRTRKDRHQKQAERQSARKPLTFQSFKAKFTRIFSTRGK